MPEHPARRFTVLTSQRTGSTWLMDLISAQPSIRAFAEPFISHSGKPQPFVDERLGTDFGAFLHYRNRHRGLRPCITRRYVARLEQSANSRVVGFKIMYNQLLRHPELLGILPSHQYRVIHLVRTNLLDHAVALAVFHKLKEEKRHVHTDKPARQVITVHLPPQQLLAQLRTLDRRMRYSRALLALWPVRHLEVAYESLVAHTQMTLHRIVSFIDAARDDSGLVMDSAFHKVSQGTTRNKISNYDQVRAALAGTRYESHLHA